MPSTQSVVKSGGNGRSCRYQAHAQRHRDLHDLRRLEAHEAEIEPALRAHRDVADDRDRDQQQHAERVQERRPSMRMYARRNLRDGDHHAEREPDARGLARGTHRGLRPPR